MRVVAKPISQTWQKEVTCSRRVCSAKIIVEPSDVQVRLDDEAYSEDGEYAAFATCPFCAAAIRVGIVNSSEKAMIESANRIIDDI